MSAALVLQRFDFRHNRIEAAAHDYELAEAGYQAACDAFDGTDERSVLRFRAASDRRWSAWERYQSYKSGG